MNLDEYLRYCRMNGISPRDYHTFPAEMRMVPIVEAAKENLARLFDESLTDWDRQFLHGVKVKA